MHFINGTESSGKDPGLLQQGAGGWMRGFQLLPLFTFHLFSSKYFTAKQFNYALNKYWLKSEVRCNSPFMKEPSLEGADEFCPPLLGNSHLVSSTLVVLDQLWIMQYWLFTSVCINV